MAETQLVQSKGKPPLKADLDDLFRLGREYADAQREWSEAFLRHKIADPKRTDNTAKAMADQDVDLTGARVAYENMYVVALHGGVSYVEKPDA